MTITKEQVVKVLEEQRLAMRDGAGSHIVCFWEHLVEAAFMFGFLNEEEMRGWKEKGRECPGHDDEGARAWCAFCGDLPYFDDEDRE